MSDQFSRRQLLVAATGSVAATAGCMDFDQMSQSDQSKPQSNIITDDSSTEMGCVERVETTAYDSGGLFLGESIELTVELVDGHGYGKAIVEWNSSNNDSIDESEAGEYDQLMDTIERGDESVTFDVDGPPKFVHLTTHCDGADETELIVEVETESDDETDSEDDSDE